MKISDLLKLSTDNLKRRKGRTFLTVLGVVIGTCSIVMMISIGVALNKNQEDTIKNMGDLTKIEVYNWKDPKEQPPLTDAVIKQIQALDNVKIATPIYQSMYMNGLEIYAGANDKYMMQAWMGQNVVGMYKEAIADYGYELIEGKYPTDKDKPFTVIVGEMTAYEFRNPKRQWPHNMVSTEPDENGNMAKPFVNVTKEKLTLKTTKIDETSKVIEKPIKVAGKIKQDFSKGYETYAGIIMDLNDLVALEKEYIKLNKIKVQPGQSKERNYQRAIVKVTEMKNVDDVVTAIEDMGYETSSAASWRKEMQKQTQTIQLILAGLGSISLLVAAIGIANTMTMAIYERRREIGIMKVLGCELKNIKGMFLAESAGIGFLGGIAGIILSYALSYLLNQVGGSLMGGGGGGGMVGPGMNGEIQKTYISIIPIWLAGAGMAFSTFVGIASGYVPASKAVKISAMTAIKNE